MNPRWLLIWALASAVLILLVPRVAPAAEPSAALVKACYRTVYKQCHDEVKRLDRKAAGECVKANFDKLAERCRALIEKEFPEVKQ